MNFRVPLLSAKLCFLRFGWIFATFKRKCKRSKVCTWVCVSSVWMCCRCQYLCKDSWTDFTIFSSPLTMLNDHPPPTISNVQSLSYKCTYNVQRHGPTILTFSCHWQFSPNQPNLFFARLTQWSTESRWNPTKKLVCNFKLFEYTTNEMKSYVMPFFSTYFTCVWVLFFYSIKNCKYKMTINWPFLKLSMLSYLTVYCLSKKSWYKIHKRKEMLDKNRTESFMWCLLTHFTDLSLSLTVTIWIFCSRLSSFWLQLKKQKMQHRISTVTTI